MNLASRLFKGDRGIWIIFMFLCLISVIEVFSATSTIAYKNANYWAPIIRHASFLLGGFFAVLIIHNWSTRFSVILGMLLPIAIILLLITPFVGVEINGERRWLSILGITFQPSEVAKLCSVCYMALVLSRRNVLSSKQMFWYILVGVGITCACILYNNGSTAIMLGMIMLMMMAIGQVGGKRIAKLVGIGIAAIALSAILYIKAPDTVEKFLPRIYTWIARIERLLTNRYEEGADEKTLVLDMDEHYQEDLAKIAIAQGGVLGKLPGHGQQRDFLPQAYSDFIYAIIIEEIGLVGGFFVLFLYLTLLVRVAIIARKCERLFPKFLILGCGLMLVTQALINMAVAVGVFPVTGQPLPLISRGGTSTVISCIYIGIILSVSRFEANIGNEKDPLPEETPEPVASALPNVTEEELNNWVPNVESDVAPQSGRNDTILSKV